MHCPPPSHLHPPAAIAAYAGPAVAGVRDCAQGIRERRRPGEPHGKLHAGPICGDDVASCRRRAEHSAGAPANRAHPV